MLDDAAKGTIDQERVNCLCTKHLHAAALRALRTKIFAVDVAALIIPVIYFPLRYLSKGTLHATVVEAVWEILAGLLIAAGIWKFTAGWQKDFERHGKAMGENIALARQAQALLNDPAATQASAQPFLVLAQRSETEDRELLLKPNAKQRQPAYREALKEHSGTGALCPICGSSPWNFTKLRWWESAQNRCQTCGNARAAQQVVKEGKKP